MASRAIKFTLASLAVYMSYCGFRRTFKAVPANGRGIKTFYGKIYEVAKPGITFVPPWSEIDIIVTGLDTDFKEDVICKTSDNEYITIPRMYVDNQFNCTTDQCIIDLYVNYFITDSKVRAKGESKYVPEDGMIFKYRSQVLAEVCETLTAYQTQTEKWVSTFPVVRDKLQKLVPNGILIHHVRMDPPILKNLEWRMSVWGMIANWNYRAFKATYELRPHHFKFW